MNNPVSGAGGAGDLEAHNKHKYDRHPTRENPMVRLVRYHQDEPAVWMRDDGAVLTEIR